MNSLFKYSYRSEINISASKKTIWSILTKCTSYPKWNPFTINVQTKWKIGQPVHLTVQMKPNRKPIAQTEYLSRFQEHSLLAWGFSFGWILKAMRTQKLIQINKTQTRYINEDTIQGLLSPLVHLLYGKWIQKGFDEISVSLKNYVENHVDER